MGIYSVRHLPEITVPGRGRGLTRAFRMKPENRIFQLAGPKAEINYLSELERSKSLGWAIAEKLQMTAYFRATGVAEPLDWLGELGFDYKGINVVELKRAINGKIDKLSILLANMKLRPGDPPEDIFRIILARVGEEAKVLEPVLVKEVAKKLPADQVIPFVLSYTRQFSSSLVARGALIGELALALGGGIKIAQTFHVDLVRKVLDEIYPSTPGNAESKAIALAATAGIIYHASRGKVDYQEIRRQGQPFSSLVEYFARQFEPADRGKFGLNLAKHFFIEGATPQTLAVIARGLLPEEYSLRREDDTQGEVVIALLARAQTQDSGEMIKTALGIATALHDTPLSLLGNSITLRLAEELKVPFEDLFAASLIMRAS